MYSLIFSVLRFTLLNYIRDFFFLIKKDYRRIIKKIIDQIKLPVVFDTNGVCKVSHALLVLTATRYTDARLS